MERPKPPIGPAPGERLKKPDRHLTQVVHGGMSYGDMHTLCMLITNHMHTLCMCLTNHMHALCIS